MKKDQSKELSKEEIQKLILGALLFFGLVYSFFDLLLNPCKARQLHTATSVNALEPEIAKAKELYRRSTEVESEAPKARAAIAQIDTLIPEGAPVAWFPVLIADFFKKAGFDKTVTRLNTEIADKDLPGYRRVSWGVDLPRVDCLGFANALAQLENQELLVEVQALTIETIREDPEAQHAFITVQNIVKQ